MAEIKKYLDTIALGALVDQIKAEDVKVKEAANAYADSLAKNYDGAGSAATAEANAKAYTDELANGQVATNKADIAKLNGDASTEGSVAKAVADAKTELTSSIEAVDAIADKNAEDIAAINNAESGILAQAKKFATEEDAKVQGDIDTLAQTVSDLDAYVGDIPSGYTESNVIAYINKKAQETLDAASGGSSESAASVLAALNTYKAEANPKIEANTTAAANAQTSADSAQSYAEGVAGDLAEAVEALEGADASQVERIAALEGQIVGLSGAMHFEGIVETDPTTITEGYENGDTVIYGNKEYVWNNGAFVEFGDVSAQAEAITDLTTRMDGAEADIEQLQKDVDAAEAAILLKADQTALDTEIQNRGTAISGLDERIQTLEGQLGDSGDVAKDIAAAQEAAVAAAAQDATTKANQALTDAKSYTDTEVGKDRTRLDALELIDHDHTNKTELDLIATGDKAKWDEAAGKAHEHANSAELAKIVDGDVAKWNVAEQNAKTYADGLNTAMTTKVDGVDARVKTLEETIVDKAESDDLDAAVLRIAANEQAIAANTSAINSFTAITADEVAALFA